MTNQTETKQTVKTNYIIIVVIYLLLQAMLNYVFSLIIDPRTISSNVQSLTISAILYSTSSFISFKLINRYNLQGNNDYSPQKALNSIMILTLLVFTLSTIAYFTWSKMHMEILKQTLPIYLINILIDYTLVYATVKLAIITDKNYGRSNEKREN